MKLSEGDKGNSQNDKNTAKKVFTYDYNGDILIVKGLKTDKLPSSLLNMPYKLKATKQGRKTDS